MRSPKVTKQSQNQSSNTPQTRHQASARTPSQADEVIRNSGQPLPVALRASMEQRLGRDFGNVRMHTDPQAADAARLVQARAYTVGSHIVFGRDRFAPGTPQGQKLLLHELSHVAQQQNVGQPGTMNATKAEGEAQATAEAGAGPVTASVATGTLQRDPLTKAEIEQLDKEQIEARIAENEEEAQMMIWEPEYYTALEEERNALLSALQGETKIPVPPFSEGRPQTKPAKRSRPTYPTASDAYSGIEMYAYVKDRLPDVTNADFYRSTPNFNIGVNLRKTESGLVAVYYLAAVKWEGMEGSQWVIGPDSIDAFVKNEDSYANATLFAPADPDAVSDWQLEVFKAQESAFKGEWGEMFRHIGRSHVEKWSDEPIQSIFELMPMPGPKVRPKVRPSIKPPRIKPRVPKVPRAKPHIPKVAPKATPKAVPKSVPKPKPKPKAPTAAKPPASKKPKSTTLAKKKTTKPKAPRKRNQYPDFEDIPNSLKKTASEQTEQLSKQLGIKLPKDRVLSAPWIGRIRNSAGKARSASTSQGWLRNESKFWSKWKKAFPDDAKLLGKGNTVTKELAEKYGWPTTGKNSVVGQKLVHHHMANSSFTVAIPESLHVKLSGAIHAKPTVIQ